MKKKSVKRFSTRWGFILASVGSAVGMANVWGFPNKMGSNGGGAFLYVGLPAEFAMGRRAATGTLGAYENAWATRGKNAGKTGAALGWLPLAGSLCIAIGYAVIVTYVLKALVDSVVGTLMTADAAVWFSDFSSRPFSVIPYHIIVVAGTLLTLFLGAHSIEKTNRIMMPVFFLIFAVLAVRVAFLPGAAAGYRFMFTPRWEILRDPMVWIWAMGQAFFSLSVTGSGMVVYGAYLSKDEDVVGVAQHTALFDTIAAVVAALVIIPACFSYGLDVGAGPGLLFVTLPTILQDIPLGRLFAIILYVAMIFAGVSSLQNMFEAVRHGDDLPMGTVDGSRFHLHHPHRRDARRGFVVLCDEKGGASLRRQHRSRTRARGCLVRRWAVCICSPRGDPLLRGALPPCGVLK